MKLYTIPNCGECSQVVSFIQENKKDVEIIELKKIDEKWMESTEDGYKVFDETVKAFPALFVGEQREGQRVFIIGKEGSINYIKKGFIHDVKICPFMGKPCIETECEKFVIMKRGAVSQGGCSDYWTPILLTEMLTKGN